ncbi:MAG: thermonuclease family protein [Acidobacteriota bacterium]
MLQGTTIEGTVVRVVDGDTVRVSSADLEDEESLRILALDTEESNAGGSKPVTPFGHRAKERAQEFFAPGDAVVLEFPGREPVDVAIQRYRGNFGRLLVYLHKDGVDFQETMIREGFSPYFCKYGNAVFHHDAYRAAEREAQASRLGVWDQIAVNGSEIRNYAALGTWWQLRARLIDDFRALRPHEVDLLDSRLDFAEISRRAQTGDTVTVFTALERVRRIGQRHALVRIGSLQQPFALFIRDIEANPESQRIVKLLETRYISAGEDHPRRSYAYVRGALRLFNGTPEIELTSIDQISDDFPGS